MRVGLVQTKWLENQLFSVVQLEFNANDALKPCLTSPWIAATISSRSLMEPHTTLMAIVHQARAAGLIAGVNTSATQKPTPPARSLGAGGGTSGTG